MSELRDDVIMWLLVNCYSTTIATFTIMMVSP